MDKMEENDNFETLVCKAFILIAFRLGSSDNISVIFTRMDGDSQVPLKSNLQSTEQEPGNFEHTYKPKAEDEEELPIFKAIMD